MKRLSLQWRITLMSVLLIGVTCVAMNLLLCSSGVYYMDTIADSLQGGGTVILNDGGAVCFDPQLIAPDEDLTIIVDGAQGRFRTTNWYITAAVTLLSGILAYFVSGRALKPLRSFASQVEQVQMNNLADMKVSEDVLPEFRQFSHSFNQMLERLNNAFAAQRQFTGNAAHEPLFHGEQLTIAPHGVVLPLGHHFLRQVGFDIVVVVDDIQNAAAFAVGQVGDSGIFLAAFDAAAADHIFHESNSPL